MGKTLADGRKKAVSTKTYATGRKKHTNVPTLQTGRSRIEVVGGRPSKTLYVLNHLKEHGKITSWEAIQLYRATRLSGIIFTLKQQGYAITTHGGEGRNFATYYLVGLNLNNM